MIDQVTKEQKSENILSDREELLWDENGLWKFSSHIKGETIENVPKLSLSGK